MPSPWDTLDRGYYDPNLGTYVQTSRINWGLTAPRAYAGQVPGELVRGWYAPEYGTYITPGDLDWSYIGRTTGMAPPSARDTSLQRYYPSRGTTPTPAGQYWRYPAGSAAELITWRNAEPAVGAQGATAGQAQTYADQGGGSQDDGGDYTSSSRHPDNAVYESDDGLISYDENFNQLDSNGNVAMGSFQIGQKRGRPGPPKDDYTLPQSMPYVEPYQFSAEMWRPPSFPAW